MSETLNPPWIAGYLINIAETYGCYLSSVPVHLKPGKKVQLIQFLTFNKDDCIWAYVSDKDQKIAVRFSRHAVAEYERDNQPDSQGKRLTQQYCAIATIKSFKPVFQRIPSGQSGKMTVLETLALFVDQVKIVGGAGEPEFGSPKALENHRELKEWIEGLRAGGGDGNVLKLRKEERLAREREEGSVPGTLAAPEQNGHRSGQQIGVTMSMDRAVLSGHQANVEQEDWRESIAKKPLRFYRRPTGNGVTASKPTPTAPNHKNGNSVPPVRRGKGALDLDSSPVVAQATFNGSPARSEHQTTPTDWAASPSLERPNSRLSPSPEAAEEQPIFQPLTPPLFSPEKPPEVPGQLMRISQPVANNRPQATPASVQQAISNGSQTTSSLKPPTPAQRRRGSVPLSSFSFAVPSTVVALSPLKKEESSPPGSVFPARMVPPPSVKNTKEACGEVLVPDSDAGGTGTQSSSIGNSSSLSRRRPTIAGGLGDVIASSKLAPSPERTNNTYDGQSPALLNPELDKDKEHLDDLSRMAVNGSYAENPQANGTQARNRVGDNNKVDAVQPSSLPSSRPEPSYEPLPPSSFPIHSQSPSWHRSTALVEETVAMERRSTQATDLRLPITKRTRPSSPSPLRSKRPRLMSREPDGGTPRKVFDPELLKVGIKVDLADYDDNPPPYPWGKGLSKLDFKAPDYPLLITNSKLAEIWKSVCTSRGWYTKSKLVNS